MCAIINSAGPALDIPCRPRSSKQRQAGISDFSAARRNQKQGMEPFLERAEDTHSSCWQTKLSQDQGGARGGIPGPGLCKDLCLNTTCPGPNPSPEKSKQLPVGSLSWVRHRRAPSHVLNTSPPGGEVAPPCSKQQQSSPLAVWLLTTFQHGGSSPSDPNTCLSLPARIPARRADLSFGLPSLLFRC